MKTEKLKKLAENAYGQNVNTDAFDQLPDDATPTQMLEAAQSIKSQEYRETCDREGAIDSLIGSIESMMEDD